MPNGQVVNYKTRRKDGTNKKTKKTTNGFTKSYIKETKKKLKRKRGNNALSYRTWNEEKEKKEKQKI